MTNRDDTLPPFGDDKSKKSDQTEETFDSNDIAAGYNAETRSVEASTDATKKQIGPYKLLQKLGEGGMGTVWMAEQQKPVRRRVALKLIKIGVDNKQVIARFEAERQAVAMMNHENIAKILDAGTTDSGQPYFVMELVQGVPFNKYCDKNNLSIQDRLELFIPVCKAVQHAHQKGIIHRDLKPSNVLVCLYDGVGVPKVIDFGLAKALEPTTHLTDKTMFTEFGQVVGTLQYMSPEQAEMNQLDIDTRTDVYSLGVMLYELLTGSTPIEQESLKGAAILSVLERIRETEPPRPSARLSSSTNEAVSGISSQRRIEPSKLKNILRGELDWIVMKSLAKDRSRRYETASSFAEDIENYLNNEVVTARPPSTGYRVKKYVKKNKGLVAALGTIAVVLMIGLLSMTLVLKSKFDAVYEAKRAEKIGQMGELREIYVDANALIVLGKENEALQKFKSILDDQAALAECFREELKDENYIPVMDLQVSDTLVGIGNTEPKAAHRNIAYDQALSIRKRLVKDAVENDDKNIPEYKRKLANVYMNIAIEEEKAGFYEKAQKQYDEAQKIREQILVDLTELKGKLVKTHIEEEKGKVYLDLGKGYDNLQSMYYQLYSNTIPKFAAARTKAANGDEMAKQEAETLRAELISYRDVIPGVCVQAITVLGNVDPDNAEPIYVRSNSYITLGVINKLPEGGTLTNKNDEVVTDPVELLELGYLDLLEIARADSEVKKYRDQVARVIAEVNAKAKKQNKNALKVLEKHAHDMAIVLVELSEMDVYAEEKFEKLKLALKLWNRIIEENPKDVEAKKSRDEVNVEINRIKAQFQ